MKKLIKLAVVGILLASTLSACVVLPLGPGYYRPHHEQYYGR